MMESMIGKKEDFFRFDLIVLNIALAFFNGVLAIVAFSQLIRIHTRQNGWTRQKVLHLMIGSSNLGYFVYFVLALVATCKLWHCWSYACGFILMACPKILFLAGYLLLLSFWIDLCHQASDEEEDDDENSIHQILLDSFKNKTRTKSNQSTHRKCCAFHSIHLGSRQKFVIVVVVLVFIVMMSFSLLIWIGQGKNPIDSSDVARAYEDFLAATVFLLGGALGCYGLFLFYRLRKVRSDLATSDTRKVVGLAVVSVVCFTSSSLVDLLTDIPFFYHWHLKNMNGVKELLLLTVYFVIGSLVPSAYVLWIMRELPPKNKIERQEEQARRVMFINQESAHARHNPQHWVTTMSSKNQASRASPI